MDSPVTVAVIYYSATVTSANSPRPWAAAAEKAGADVRLREVRELGSGPHFVMIWVRGALSRLLAGGRARRRGRMIR